MDSSDASKLLILFILLLFSAFFSSAETCLTTVNKMRLKSMADEGNKKAALVLKLISNQTKMLSSILIGNNIVNLFSLYESRNALKISVATADKFNTVNGFIIINIKKNLPCASACCVINLFHTVNIPFITLTIIYHICPNITICTFYKKAIKNFTLKNIPNFDTLQNIFAVM